MNVEAKSRSRLHHWWRLLTSSLYMEFCRREREALPEGARVRLLCECKDCALAPNAIWRASWTPRRLHDIGGPDDYQLTRESDGKVLYAHREDLELVHP